MRKGFLEGVHSQRSQALHLLHLLFGKGQQQHRGAALQMAEPLARVRRGPSPGAEITSGQGL